MTRPHEPRPIIREATEADFRQFYGKIPWTFRAYVVEIDGQIMGIGGVYYDGESIIAFSSIRPELKRHKVTILKGARKVMGLVNGRACLAIASKDHAGSERLLEHLGFERVGDRVFRWVN